MTRPPILDELVVWAAEVTPYLVFGVPTAVAAAGVLVQRSARGLLGAVGATAGFAAATATFAAFEHLVPWTGFLVPALAIASAEGLAALALIAGAQRNASDDDDSQTGDHLDVAGEDAADAGLGADEERA